MRAYALKNPDGDICTFCIRQSPFTVRKDALKYCTVFGGKQPHETWKWLFKKGYRCVRVTLSESKDEVA